jgi:hypothetical protein
VTAWWKYGPCETCGADPDKPCGDLRSGRPLARPHRHRHVKWWLPRQPEEATRGR